MATDLENLFEQLRQGLGLLKPKQVDLLASHFYQQQIQALTKEALEDFEDHLQAKTKTSTETYRFQNTFGWSKEEVIKASKDPLKGVINVSDLKESYLQNIHNRGLMSGYVSSYTYQRDMMN